MWFSLKRTTCCSPKPPLSTGNQGQPRDLQFRGPLVETRNSMLKQNCHLEQATRGCELEDQMSGFLYQTTVPPTGRLGYKIRRYDTYSPESLGGGEADRLNFLQWV